MKFLDAFFVIVFDKQKGERNRFEQPCEMNSNDEPEKNKTKQNRKRDGHVTKPQ